MTIRPSCAIISLLLCSVASCGGSDDTTAEPPPGGTDAGVGDTIVMDQTTEMFPDSFVQFDGPNPDGTVGDTQSDGDGACGASGFAVEATPPNMLIVFDRSCSMRRLYDNPNQFGSGPNDPATRWYAAREAVDVVTTQHDNRIRFGIMVFPAPRDGCGDTPPIDVLPDVNNHGPVLGVLLDDLIQPFNLCDVSGAQPHQTPTGEALDVALQSSALKDPDRENFILLMTDGQASCGETPSTLGAQAAALLNEGIKTAVVGFGDASSSTGTNMLNAIAQAGGFPKPGGPPHFWFAEQPTDLQNALDTIVAQSISCTYNLQGTPPDSDKLYAFVDGVELPPGPPDGWEYDPQTNTVTFLGATCDGLKAGDIQSINVVYGCPEDLCVPTDEVCDGLDNDCDGQVDEVCPA